MRKIIKRAREYRDWFDLDFPPEIARQNEEEGRYYFRQQVKEWFPHSTDFAQWLVFTAWWHWSSVESHFTFAGYVLTGKLPRGWYEDDLRAEFY